GGGERRVPGAARRARLQRGGGSLCRFLRGALGERDGAHVRGHHRGRGRRVALVVLARHPAAPSPVARAAFQREIRNSSLKKVPNGPSSVGRERTSFEDGV